MKGQKSILTFISVVLSASLIPPILSYGTGAPVEVVSELCADMTPQHIFAPQDSPSPYGLSLDREEVAPGGTVRVTISSTPQDKIMGFLAIGRLSTYPNETAPYGSFVNNSDRSIQLNTCSNLPDTAATHTSNDVKETVELTWQAPAVEGDFLISVTIVRDFYTCWVATRSQIISVRE